VEVTDAAGVQQLRRILNAGEVVPVVGALPLAVVVGRADAVDVLVRGQTFDLAGLARDNVARFQIK
jgi:cytoskeleton protein RodZ